MKRIMVQLTEYRPYDSFIMLTRWGPQSWRQYLTAEVWDQRRRGRKAWVLEKSIKGRPHYALWVDDKGRSYRDC